MPARRAVVGSRPAGPGLRARRPDELRHAVRIDRRDDAAGIAGEIDLRVLSRPRPRCCCASVTAIENRTTSVHAQTSDDRSLSCLLLSFTYGVGSHKDSSERPESIHSREEERAGVFARSFAVIALVVASACEPSSSRSSGGPFETETESEVSHDSRDYGSRSRASRKIHAVPRGRSASGRGDAAAAFTLENRPPRRSIVRCTPTAASSVRPRSTRSWSRLDDVKPYPKIGATIAPADYRATLVVTRR